jgi:hypothetical protein
LDEQLRTRFHTLSENIVDATDAVNRVLDAEDPSVSEIDDSHRRVAECNELYKELFALVPHEQQAHVERTHGRRLTDLRRLAGRLPARSTGTAVGKATDVPAGGGWPFLLQREPPKSIESQRYAPTRRGDGPHYSVGREVEAWCGACGGLREHNIIAIVDGLPKQVICLACNARHAYRTEPVRSKKAVEAEAAAQAKAEKPRKPTAAELEAQKKEAARFALQKELAEATDVRTFSPKLSYKAGEIINHPEHGRGKVENVVRGSILVRFRSGLKALTTY